MSGVANAALNQASNVGGGGVTLTNSGTVEVLASALQLVKQVWIGGTCMASIPADAACNGSAITVTVPSGTALKFMIFVKNNTAIAISDVRFQDAIDDTAGAAGGFTPTAASLKYDMSQNGSATAANIYTAVIAGTAETDAVDAGAGNYASILNTGGTAALDNLTVGAVPGQVNATLNVNANTTFAIVFDAVKN
ncbi:MAG: hypothetical protein A2V90_05505 [Gammaproteobacteria bacterium RBG_16_57_12]|nr:MAG: hypothetical protein A2V90_05505 [Gammaproteobacteria bacterium RBG_16_57_12]